MTVKQTIEVVTPDDIVREGMCVYIRQHAPQHIVRVAHNLNHISQWTAHSSVPDLLFLDTEGYTVDELIGAIQSLKPYPHTKVVALDNRLTAAHVLYILQNGGRGVIHKAGNWGREVLDAISIVALGTNYLSPDMTEVITSGQLILHHLNDRQRQILYMMVDGARPTQIAEQLSFAEKTIYRDQETLRETLQVHTNAQLIAEAIRLRLISL
ncbi:MAG: LuxR C-terminal-related transcriptional regulator [Chloroflexota bacterium]